MIDARELYSLVGQIVDSLLDVAEDEDEPSRAALRERLADFAGSHDLTFDDTATLYRVAAGELPHSPAYSVRYHNLEETPR